MSGDLDIAVRVASIENVDRWSKAGLMIRETLAADSRHVDMIMTADRTSDVPASHDDCGIDDVARRVTSLAIPYWVRLVRQGNVFTGYRSQTASPGHRLTP